MRHVQEHAAQLNLILGQKIGWGPKWAAQAKKKGGGGGGGGGGAVMRDVRVGVQWG